MSELLPKIIHDEPLVPLPTDEADLKLKLADHEWRLFSIFCERIPDDRSTEVYFKF